MSIVTDAEQAEREERERAEAAAREIVLTYWTTGGREIVTGNVTHLADNVQRIDYGYADIAELKAYALDEAGELVRVFWRVRAERFDANDYSFRTVTLTLPDGVVATAGYSIDGRV